MDKRQMETRLGRFLSFLEQKIQEAHVAYLPPLPKGKTYPLEYYQNQAREQAYRRTEEELRRLFPKIDIYGRLEDQQLRGGGRYDLTGGRM